ncbi:MAG: hypothetical protein V1723_03470 [Candidatus Uhrbacteria bacterium]
MALVVISCVVFVLLLELVAYLVYRFFPIRRWQLLGYVMMPIAALGIGLLICWPWPQSHQAQQGTVSVNSESSDAGQPRIDCPLPRAQCVKFTAACEAFRISTPANIAVNWSVLQAQFLDLLTANPWLHDRFYWFELDKLNGALAGCGIHDLAQVRSMSRAIIAVARNGDKAMSQLLTDTRARACSSGAIVAETTGETDWTAEQRAMWESACLKLLSGSLDALGVGLTPRSSDGTGGPDASIPANTAAPKRCVTLETLRNAKPDSVGSSEPDWLAYGLALAACGPGSMPWSALNLSREQYVQQYILTFFSEDLKRGSLFARQHSNQYEGIYRAWGLEG